MTFDAAGMFYLAARGQPWPDGRSLSLLLAALLPFAASQLPFLESSLAGRAGLVGMVVLLSAIQVWARLRQWQARRA